jgi:outer membrane protein TolC
LHAEVHTLTLRQALDQALNQNPDLTIARIETQRAELAVRVARDPFSPKLVVGSGLAYTTGYPMSIEGSAPTIFQAKTIMTIYNQSQKYLVAQARENMRTAGIDENAKRDEVAFRTASLYLDVLRVAQSRDLSVKQVDSFRSLAEIVRARVAEGRELPVNAKQAEINLTRAQQRAELLGMDLDYGQASLAITLGYPADDRVKAVDETIRIGNLPMDENEAIDTALANNKDLKKLESQLIAKGYEVKSNRAARLPAFDLVAQYGLLSQYNYQDFFARFQRNSGQLGISIQWPLLAGSASTAQASRAEAEQSRIRTETVALRDRITVETRKSFADIRRAQLVRELAKQELDLSREQLSVLLAQMEEGRASLQQVDQARSAENEKWLAFYDSQHSLERAELSLLKQTGTLLAALQK